MKRTKIVCTIGPASNNLKTLKRMIHAGMNVARLNFSHGTYETHTQLINSIRRASKETGKVIMLFQDLQGPRIRLAALPKEGINVRKGDKVIFSTAKKVTAGKIGVTYAKLSKEIKAGHRILIADGVFEFMVTAVKGDDITCKALTGAKLTSNKGMNFPDTTISISSLSSKDLADLDFGIKMGVDYVALSFVRTANDVNDLRRRILNLEKKHRIKKAVAPKIISKIEMPDAIKNFDAILEASDAIMVARGDLGIEMNAEDVPLLQKQIISKCNAAAKPVIVATQMLESMIINPRPTRAEVSDVANAVIDHTDAVMLSGESASGQYPVEAVEIMSKTAHKVERSHYDDLNLSHCYHPGLRITEAVAETAVALAQDVKAKAMIVLSMTGTTARFVSKYRPELPIIVTTSSGRVSRQLTLSWGVVPLEAKRGASDEKLINHALAYAKKEGMIKNGDHVVLIKGHPVVSKRQQPSSIELISF